MKNHLKIITAIAFAFAPLGASAAVLGGFGQPILVLDGDDASGSILNFFDFGLPSDLEDLSLSGTITKTFGAPSLVDTNFAFESSEAMARGAFTLGNTTLREEDTNLFMGFGNYDPFQSGPGDLNISVFVLPPLVQPNALEFDYIDEFDEFPNRINVVPEFELLISVFLDGPLPMKVLNDPLFGPIEYIEGPLAIDRIEIATAGGAPLAPVPLPATGFLLFAGLLVTHKLRRRS